MDKNGYKFLENVKSVCDEMYGKPVAAFVRGKVGKGLHEREALIMLVGPTLTMQTLSLLRNEILECLDAKEKQLKGEAGPDTAVFYY